MTREEYSRTLRYMEHIRLASYEAETERHRLQLEKEYAALSRQIAPFIDQFTNLP